MTITFNPLDKDAGATLSNSNLTLSTTGGFLGARCVLPLKASGKAYVRLRIDTASPADGYVGIALTDIATPTSFLFGNSTRSVLCYSTGNGTGSSFYNNAGSGKNPPSGCNTGDWLVLAIDLDTGNVWYSNQTAGGVLNTNWNDVSGSPAAGTGADALTGLAGLALVPGCSALGQGGGTAIGTIDCDTVISDATLAGFVPWAALAAPTVFNSAIADTSLAISAAGKTLTKNSSDNSWAISGSTTPATRKSYFSVRFTGTSGQLVSAGLWGSAQINFTGSAVGQNAEEEGCQVNIGGGGNVLWHDTANAGACTPIGGSGSYLVVAHDPVARRAWITAMSSGGALDTNWNNGANSPAAGTGGIDVSTSQGFSGSLQPAAGLFNTGMTATLDTTSVIADSTLSGFSPWDGALTTWDPANKDASIALSGGNLIATLSGGGWKSAIATGPAKTSGKWYFRVQGTHTAGFITGAICPSSTPTNDFLGGPPNSYIGYVNVPASGGSLSGPSGSAGGFNFTGSTADGDYVVIAYDADNGGIYFTGMLASGSLDSSWNGTTGNPSTGSHPISVTPGLALLPAVSLLSGDDVATLDTTTVITDPTLSGFLPWDAPATTDAVGAAAGSGTAIAHSPVVVAAAPQVGGAVMALPISRPAPAVLSYAEAVLPSLECDGEIEALAPPAAVDGRAAGRLPGLRVEARALLPGEARLPLIRFAALGAQMMPGRASLIMPGLGVAAKAIQDLADDELMVILLAA